MNKSAIQKFAIQARRDLIEQVQQRAYQYGVEESDYGDISADAVGGRMLTPVEKSQRQALIRRIQEKGYQQVMEEVAYTWFNRFVALRFMEVNNYLPSHIRVFSDASGAFKPEILSDVLHLELDGLDQTRVSEYLESNDTEGLYRYLLLTQCNALNEALPVMFQRMGSDTELLLPNNILRQDSVLGHLVLDIPEEDWQDQVQIIGWMYQYYNSELKDDTFALLKKNVKITKERIPAATQLFTPDWIVRYMVENSLGRIFVSEQLSVGSGQRTEEERIAKEKEIAEKMGWKYYLPEAEQSPEVRKELNQLTTDHLSLTTLKVIDPCMGSGHILVYAFDVLMQIYTAAGWDQREAAQSILKNNLYGLDIDDRAAQLAYFAVMMKARQYDRRFFSRGIQPNVYAIRESNEIQNMTVEYFHKNDPKLKADIERIVTEMRDAKEYGSILNITPVDFAGLYARFDEIREDINMMQQVALDELLPLVQCAELLAQKYDVVVTNPPYMGSSGMNPKLAQYVKDNYPNTKSDMSTVFMEKTVKICKKAGYMSMINIPVWMFLSSYEKLRESLITQNTFANMVHFGRGVFGSDFGTTAFVIAKNHINGYEGTYCRLFEKQGAVDSVETKEKWFLEGMGRFVADQSNFSKIPGSPVAYWASETVVRIFANNKNIDEIAAPRQGLATGNNEQYLRFWPEISYQDIMRNAKSHEEFFQSNKKYIPYNKGGAFRKWLAHIEWLIRFDKPNYDVLQTVGNHLPSKDFYFRDSITWSKVTSGGLSMRYMPNGSVFDVAGCSIFTDENLYYLLAFTNTIIMQYLMNVLSQTLNYEVGNVKSIPIVIDNCNKNTVEKIANQNLRLSFADESSYETSWDFKRNPLV